MYTPDLKECSILDDRENILKQFFENIPAGQTPEEAILNLNSAIFELCDFLRESLLTYSKRSTKD